MRAGGWIQTHSGSAFWPLDPRADEVKIEDIAQSLSLSCRYRGHCSRFYSVAEHSVLVSHAVPPEHAMWGLLHDAAEAYLCDAPAPIKPFLPGFREMEAAVMAAVCQRFALPTSEPAEVKRADVAILGDERAALLPGGPDWHLTLPPLGVPIVGMPPDFARYAFLRRYEELRLARLDFAGLPSAAAVLQAPPAEEGAA